MPLSQAEKDNLLTKADSLRADIAALVADGAPPPPPVPTATISVEPASVESGQAATLTWSTTDADEASINGEPVALSGSRQESPTTNATYTLTATGPGGAVQASATLAVTQPPPPPGGLVIDGYYEFEELHIHEGETLTLLPGAELVRLDVPPADPAHGDGGIVIHGHLQAVRGPSDAPIVIRSQNPAGHRGHLMIHGTAVLDGVEVRDFGRTTNAPISASNPIARYAVHWHLAGDNGRTSRIENCLVHDTVTPSTFRFGIVIHATHGVVCRNNTVRNKCGSGIYLEDKTEIDNLIEGNIVEDITDRALNTWTKFPARPDSVESGMEGSGIWWKNGNNIIRGNTVRRAPYGYMLFVRGSSPPGAVPQVVREFSDNLAEFCHKALEYWEVGSPDADSVFTRLTARDCVFGVYPYPGWRIVIESPVFERCDTGWVGTDYLQRGILLRNVTAIDCVTGISAPNQAEDQWEIDGGLLRCTTNINVKQMTVSHTNAAGIPPRRSIIKNVRHEARTGKPLRAIVASILDGWSFRTLNLTLNDEIHVENHNGVEGDNFRVYWNEQRPDFVLPLSDLPRLIASPGPEPMTNSDAFAEYGKCFHGSLLPADATTREGIVGWIAPQP